MMGARAGDNDSLLQPQGGRTGDPLPWAVSTARGGRRRGAQGRTVCPGGLCGARAPPTEGRRPCPPLRGSSSGASR